MEQIRTYKTRLDLYYKFLMLYLMFLLIYSLIRGDITSNELRIVFHDPIIYITLIFIVYSVVALVVNYIKSKQIIIVPDGIIFKNRFGERKIELTDIIQIRFSRERRRNVEYRSEIKKVSIKLKNRKRKLRIRLAEFYDEKRLIGEFKNISKKISGEKIAE